MPALLVALLGACATQPGGSPSGAESSQHAVQILRTAHGVAHIQAADFEALAYGVAYAHAQDNVCQTADQLVTVRGERSRFFGPRATAMLGLRTLPNEQIDIFVRGLMEDGELALAQRTVSAEARAIEQGYVAGFNRFLADHTAGSSQPVPAPCAGQPWLRPMTLFDYRRLNELMMRQAGTVAFADAILAARLPERGAEAPAPVNLAAATRALAAFRLDEHLGTGGWAFGADTSANGRGVLLGNVQGPWSGANRYWQMHLTIPGQLDVMGASQGHGAVVQVGFNKDVAWTHTASTGRRFTLHELKLVPGDPASYLVGTQAERMRARTVRYDALNDRGEFESRQHTIWMTRFGPIIAIPGAGLNWTAQVAYALQDANVWNVRAVDTWLTMNRATSVGDLEAALRQQGLPGFNTVAADRAGDALYADVSTVPDVDAAQLQRCAPSRPAAQLFAATGVVVLDGSRTECQWRQDPAAPVPGLTPIERMPMLIRRDWVQNAGDSFWLSNPSLALAGISPLVGPVNTAQRLGTRAGIVQIQDRLSGQDGLAPHGQVGPAELQAMLFSNRSHAAELVLDDLLAECARPADAARTPTRTASAASSAPAASVSISAPAPAPETSAAQVRPAAPRPGVAKAPAKLPAKSSTKSPAPPAGAKGGHIGKAATPALRPAAPAAPKATPPAAAARAMAPPVVQRTVVTELGREACAVLRSWNRRDDIDSRGAHLFRDWWRAVRGLPGLWRRPFNAQDPVHTPSGLNVDDAALRNQLFAMLDQVAEALRAAGVALDAPLGDLQHRPTAWGDIALHGGDEGEGVLNGIALAAGTAAPAQAGGSIDAGSGYLQTVTFDERGPVAQALSTYGQSSWPGSPWAFDQLPLFASKQWPVLPFHADDVAKAAVGERLRLVLPAPR